MCIRADAMMRKQGTRAMWVAVGLGKAFEPSEILPLLFFAGFLGFLIWSYFHLPPERRRRRLGAIIATVGAVMAATLDLLPRSLENPEALCDAPLALSLAAFICLGVGGYLIFRKPKS